MGKDSLWKNKGDAMTEDEKILSIIAGMVSAMEEALNDDRLNDDQKQVVSHMVRKNKRMLRENPQLAIQQFKESVHIIKVGISGVMSKVGMDEDIDGMSIN